MPLPPEGRARAVPPARHEFGHYIIAKVLGFEVREVFLRIEPPPIGHSGGSGIKKVKPVAPAEVTAYLRDRIKVLFAGSLAEALDNGVVNEQEAKRVLHEASGQDNAIAKELIQVICSLNNPPGDEAALQTALTDLENAIWAEAKALVERESGLIVALANDLADRVPGYSQLTVFPKAEIDAVPAMRGRFGA
jgi:hypothetical protein